ncbi:MAG TPA: SDR family oxidoreductase [Longimicrobiaceae bacterium]|jgi:NAD(P)-dependent dehydrogenase (short-subunit alcohol dehydrogenase family)|nr:SDR family oxidoreductase [Longimicrobiaceae bacterium]
MTSSVRPPQRDLGGRVALVTGGAVRVGRAISLTLAGEGMRLVVHYNSSAEAAEALVAEVRAQGGEAVALAADLADGEAVERLAREAEAAFGGVDVLVNNASVFPPERLEETGASLWDHTMAVNLRAPFLLTRALAATLRARRGVVVNIADLAGMQAWEGYAAHSISKAGLIHLTKVAARALAPEVRVVAIAPGTVLPPENLGEDEVRRLAERAPLRRNGSPDDVVAALLYLLRADFVTGDTLVVDGGRLLRS